MTMIKRRFYHFYFVCAEFVNLILIEQMISVFLKLFEKFLLFSIFSLGLKVSEDFHLSWVGKFQRTYTYLI